MALRGYDVQHHDFRTKTVAQGRSLTNLRKRGFRKIDRQKNLLNFQHHPPAGKPECPDHFLRMFQPGLEFTAIARPWRRAASGRRFGRCPDPLLSPALRRRSSTVSQRLRASSKVKVQVKGSGRGPGAPSFALFAKGGIPRLRPVEWRFVVYTCIYVCRYSVSIGDTSANSADCEVGEQPGGADSEAGGGRGRCTGR